MILISNKHIIQYWWGLVTKLILISYTNCLSVLKRISLEFIQLDIHKNYRKHHMPRCTTQNTQIWPIKMFNNLPWIENCLFSCHELWIVGSFKSCEVHNCKLDWLNIEPKKLIFPKGIRFVLLCIHWIMEKRSEWTSNQYFTNQGNFSTI